MYYLYLTEEAEFSSWNQNCNPVHWSPKSLPFPLYSEISHGKGSPGGLFWWSPLSCNHLALHDAQPCCLPLGIYHRWVGISCLIPFLGEQNPPVPLSQAPGLGSRALSGWDSSIMTIYLERSHSLFAYSSHSPPAWGQKPALICVQAWEVMALINSCITIWISFSFGVKHNHFKTFTMLAFLKPQLNLIFISLVRVIYG